MKEVELPTLICRRCHHEWTPKKSMVIRCAKCKSVKWDEPKKK